MKDIAYVFTAFTVLAIIAVLAASTQTSTFITNASKFLASMVNKVETA
jgi:hypothetical protein